MEKQKILPKYNEENIDMQIAYYNAQIDELGKKLELGKGQKIGRICKAPHIQVGEIGILNNAWIVEVEKGKPEYLIVDNEGNKLGAMDKNGKIEVSEELIKKFGAFIKIEDKPQTYKQKQVYDLNEDYYVKKDKSGELVDASEEERKQEENTKKKEKKQIAAVLGMEKDSDIKTIMKIEAKEDMTEILKGTAKQTLEYGTNYYLVIDKNNKAQLLKEGKNGKPEPMVTHGVTEIAEDLKNGLGIKEYGQILDNEIDPVGKNGFRITNNNDRDQEALIIYDSTRQN